MTKRPFSSSPNLVIETRAIVNPSLYEIFEVVLASFSQ